MNKMTSMVLGCPCELVGSIKTCGGLKEGFRSVNF